MSIVQLNILDLLSIVCKFEQGATENVTSPRYYVTVIILVVFSTFSVFDCGTYQAAYDYTKRDV